MPESELERIRLKKELIQLEHDLKLKRDKLFHKNCMARLEKIGELGLKNLTQY